MNFQCIEQREAGQRAFQNCHRGVFVPIDDPASIGFHAVCVSYFPLSFSAGVGSTLLHGGSPGKTEYMFISRSLVLYEVVATRCYCLDSSDTPLLVTLLLKFGPQFGCFCFSRRTTFCSRLLIILIRFFRRLGGIYVRLAKRLLERHCQPVRGLRIQKLAPPPTKARRMSQRGHVDRTFYFRCN